MRALAALWGTPDTHRLTLARLNAAASSAVGHRHYYDLVEAYHQNNALYDWLAEFTRDEGVKQEALKGIRTPAKRITAFYQAHLWPGDLDEAFPLEFPDTLAAGQQEAVEAALRRVWEWSNWAAEKDVCALWLALHGDLFLRVAQPPERDAVYLEKVKPQWVTDVTSERGHVKTLRLDVPLADYTNAPAATRVVPEDRWHTEHWSKSAGVYRRWVHKWNPDTPLGDLGAPDEVLPLSAYGVDFVPFVQARFEDGGGERGSSCFEGGLDKFDELNRKATRASQLLFNHNHPDWALERAGQDPSGRPMPAPQVTDADGVVTIGDERFFRVPGGWTLRQLVAQLDYAAYQAALDGDEAAVAADFPEMIWSRLSGATELSGRALEKLLAPAVARCRRARGNADRALQRAHMMALSVGAASGISGFEGFGEGAYEAGLLMHTFAPRPVLPPDPLSDAEADKAAAEAAILRLQLGWSKKQVQRDLGLSDGEIDAMAEEEEADAEQAADKLLTALDRGAMPPGGPGAFGQPSPPLNGQAPPANGQFGRR